MEVYILLQKDDEWDNNAEYIGVYSSVEKAKASALKNFGGSWNFIEEWVYRYNVGVSGAWTIEIVFKGLNKKQLMTILVQEVDMWEK